MRIEASKIREGNLSRVPTFVLQTSFLIENSKRKLKPS